MATFAKDQTVRVRAVIPEGPVKAFRMDPDTGEVFCLVEWTDAQGAVQQRWFAEATLEAV
jgi:hypothetical protein